jgi:uncharacterized repeat protein (TIGR01451 family)
VVDDNENIYVSYNTDGTVYGQTSTGNRDIVVFKLSQYPPSLLLVLYTATLGSCRDPKTFIGDLITYNYSIKNTSDVPLTNLMVHDTLVNQVILQQTTQPTNHWNWISPSHTK